MNASAHAIAEHFEGHTLIKAVCYPFLASHKNYELAKKQMRGGGTTLAIEFDLPQDKVFAFMDALTVIDISNNLGDSKSLMTHPASTTHRRLDTATQERMGITTSTVRLSVGLENVNDLIRDLESALNTL
jgi:O-succinylhomoserine sulfhydrylase